MKLDIVIPVLNEEKNLSDCVEEVINYCNLYLSSWDFGVVIADNGSTDRTGEIGKCLVQMYSAVSYIRLEQRGRGRALKQAWSKSDADVVSYMDVHLSTDLGSLSKPVEHVSTNRCDICVGSRLLPDSKVRNRSLRRSFISRSYSFIFRVLFLVSFRDAQCGFKVILKSSLDKVLPHVKDSGWFFDTELLILSEKSRYKICEIPVIWTDDPDSKVNVIETAWKDIKGLLRLRFGGLSVCKKIISNRCSR